MAQPCAIREIAERNVQLLALKPARGHLRCATRARLVGRPALRDRGGPLAPRRRHAGQGRRRRERADARRARPRRAGELPRDRHRRPGRRASACRSTRVEVEVQADFDARGELGMGRRPARLQRGPLPDRDREPGPPRASSTSCSTLAERHSPYLDVFGRAMALRGAAAPERRGGLTPWTRDCSGASSATAGTVPPRPTRRAGAPSSSPRMR